MNYKPLLQCVSFGGALSLVIGATPAFAQQSPGKPSLPDPIQSEMNGGVIEIGNTAETSAGQVGERMEARDAFSANPIGRVNSRIQNRVQNRIDNRIDKDRNSRATALSSFRTAEANSHIIREQDEPR